MPLPQQRWLIDDFSVAEPHLWLGVGEALLSHATTLIHEHGGVQIVVVGADRDLAKTEICAARTSASPRTGGPSRYAEGRRAS